MLSEGGVVREASRRENAFQLTCRSIPGTRRRAFNSEANTNRPSTIA
jgi:hypothetical protein